MIWHGKSGTAYQFELYSIEQEFNPVAGVYVFCSIGRPAGLTPLALYVGETDSFQDRLNSRIKQHEGFKRASTAGATHVSVMVVSGSAKRLEIETDLRRGLNPPCNAQGIGNGLGSSDAMPLGLGPFGAHPMSKNSLTGRRDEMNAFGNHSGVGIALGLTGKTAPGIGLPNGSFLSGK
jgi:hypothetical protein